MTADADRGATDRTPQVASDGAGRWLVAWESDLRRGGAGKDYDLLFARSRDAGTSWSTPAALHLNSHTDNGKASNIRAADLVTAIATDGAGTWIAGFLRLFVPQGSAFSYTRSLTDCNCIDNPPTLDEFPGNNMLQPPPHRIPRSRCAHAG